jgi:small subunit ribosomal protein S16
MSLKIRLARGGTKKRPHYRIVIADARSPRDGRFIERVGTYDPMLPKEHPGRVTMNEDRIRHWLSMGAQPSDRVGRFLSVLNMISKASVPEQTKKHLPKTKAQERAKAAVEAAAAKVSVEEEPVEVVVAEPTATADDEGSAESVNVSAVEGVLSEDAPAVEPIEELKAEGETMDDAKKPDEE